MNPRAITEAERPWLEALDVGTQAELMTRIRDLGYSNDVAAGIVGWLVVKVTGGKDTTSSPTRSRYRKVLAEVNAAGSPPRRPRGDRHACDHDDVVTAIADALHANGNDVDVRAIVTSADGTRRRIRIEAKREAGSAQLVAA